LKPIDIDDYTPVAVQDLLSRVAAGVSDKDLDALLCLEKDLERIKCHVQNLYYETRRRVSAAYDSTEPEEE
jgi:hypothetical protein